MSPFTSNSQKVSSRASVLLRVSEQASKECISARFTDSRAAAQASHDQFGDSRRLGENARGFSVTDQISAGATETRRGGV